MLPGNATIHRTVLKIAKTCIDVNVLYVETTIVSNLHMLTGKLQFSAAKASINVLLGLQ